LVTIPFTHTVFDTHDIHIYVSLDDSEGFEHVGDRLEHDALPHHI
jgi:hypothetical protein